MKNTRYDAAHVLRDVDGKSMNISGQNVCIHVDKREHLDDILKLYDEVHVRKRPVMEMLDRKHRNSFYRAGGMFDKPSREQLEALMEGVQSAVATLTQNGEVVGVLSMTTDMNVFEGMTYRREDSETLTFREAMENRLVFNPIDIVLSPRTSGLAYVLLYNVCRAFYDMDYRYWAVEIYTIDYFEKMGDLEWLDDRNNSSTTLVERVGGGPVARLEGRVVKIEDVRIVIGRNIYKVEMAKSLRVMEMKKGKRGCI